MKTVQGDEIPLVRGLEYRGGMFHSRRLIEGTPGTVDNFQLGVGVSQGDFYSPRHRHNFEQIRVQLDGEAYFDRDGTMTPGVVGYFPEGVFYGPQSQRPGMVSTTAVLQFGGASGCGYLSNKEVRASMEGLNKLGEFKNGVFRRKEPLYGKKNADGNQAIWEHHHGRPIVIPKPRYAKPVMMDSQAYNWIAVEGAPGVSEKLLGVFTERRTEAGRLKLDPGAAYQAKGRGVYLVLWGKGAIGDTDARALTTLYLELGETAKISATEEMEIMHFGLPNLAGVTMTTEHDEDPADEIVSEAAE